MSLKRRFQEKAIAVKKKAGTLIACTAAFASAGTAGYHSAHAIYTEPSVAQTAAPREEAQLASQLRRDMREIVSSDERVARLRHEAAGQQGNAAAYSALRHQQALAEAARDARIGDLRQRVMTTGEISETQALAAVLSVGNDKLDALPREMGRLASNLNYRDECLGSARESASPARQLEQAEQCAVSANENNKGLTSLGGVFGGLGGLVAGFWAMGLMGRRIEDWDDAMRAERRREEHRLYLARLEANRQKREAEKAAREAAKAAAARDKQAAAKPKARKPQPKPVKKLVL